MDRTEAKIIANLHVYFPIRVIVRDGKRQLQARDNGRSFWRMATPAEHVLVCGTSNKVKALLLGEGGCEQPE